MVGAKRIKGKTPSGGDYAMIYYLDDEKNPVEESKATRTIIQEFTNSGELVNTTYGFIGGKNHGNDNKA